MAKYYRTYLNDKESDALERMMEETDGSAYQLIKNAVRVMLQTEGYLQLPRKAGYYDRVRVPTDDPL